MRTRTRTAQLVAAAALVLCALCAPVRAQSAALDFQRGIELYRRGDFAAAESSWRAALEQRPTEALRAALAYDLGNAAFRQERVHEAVGWYEAARRLAPRDKDVWANLEYARRKAELQPADRGDLRSTLQRLLACLRPREAERLALGGMALLGLALLFEALRGGALWRRLSVLALLVLALCCLPLAWQLAHARGGELLVIAREGATLRSEPRPDLPAVGRVEPGASAWQIDQLSEWVRVEAEGGQRGWTGAEGVFALAR